MKSEARNIRCPHQRCGEPIFKNNAIKSMRISYSFFLSLVFLTTAFPAAAQTVALKGILNRYAAVTALDTCNGRLSVSDTTGFRAGQSILLIQMKGATIASGNNVQYGQLINLGSTGLYERALVDSVAPEALYLRHRPVHAYQFGNGRVQAVTLPIYENATVTDTLRPAPWNGLTGGILAFEVTKTLILDAPVVADGAGFRGGKAFTAEANNCSFLFQQTGYFYGVGNWRGAFKGEGAVDTDAGRELGRGPQLNGGGGGNDHNTGGGGGANVSDGGRGGENREPDAVGCDGFYPGFGAYGLPSFQNRIFMGGGGGAGHANNYTENNGGRGGGIVLIKADSIGGGKMSIGAAGTEGGTAEGDGGGGGGAGGTIRLELRAAAPGIVLRAGGGNGGNADARNAGRCQGPGGGGGGGRILANLGGLAAPAGGAAGKVINSGAGCSGSSNNAAPGKPGLAQTLVPLVAGAADYQVPRILVQPQPRTGCLGKPAVFTVETTPGTWTYRWQRFDGAAWQNLEENTEYKGVQTPTLNVLKQNTEETALRFRCLVARTACYTAVSAEAGLTFLSKPAADFGFTTDGFKVNFEASAQNAAQFRWDFGDGGSDTILKPQHIYAKAGDYPVKFSAWNACDTVVINKTISLQAPLNAAFSVADTTSGCGAATVVFENKSTGNNAAVQWSFPGGTPPTSTAANPSIKYNNSGAYKARLIVSNGAANDTFERDFTVRVTKFPAADFSYKVLADGTVEFVNLSKEADINTWDFGDEGAGANTATATHRYKKSGEYTVTLTAANSCGASILQKIVTVDLNGVGTQETATDLRLRLYPNPSAGRVYLDCTECSETLRTVQVFDTQGRLLRSPGIGAGPVYAVDLEGLSAGVYVLRADFGHRRAAVRVILE
jgi:PKD repeat protein